MDLHTASRAVVAELEAHGINAAADPRDLSLPGVLVLPAKIKAETLSVSWVTVTWDLVLIVPAAGAPHHLVELGDLTAKVIAVIGPAELEARTFSDPSLGSDLPALITQTTTEEDI